MQAAVRALLAVDDGGSDDIGGNDYDDDDIGGNDIGGNDVGGNDIGEDETGSNDGGVGTGSVVRFDVAVFVAATEDARRHASAPLAHAKLAFAGVQRWALEDDCQAVGDPALLLWARAAPVVPVLRRVRAAENDGSSNKSNNSSSSSSGGAPADTSEAHLTEASTIGDDETDRSFPAALGVTAHATATLRRLLRRVKQGGQPFTVCRPGYGNAPLGLCLFCVGLSPRPFCYCGCRYRYR